MVHTHSRATHYSCSNSPPIFELLFNIWMAVLNAAWPLQHKTGTHCQPQPPPLPSPPPPFPSPPFPSPPLIPSSPHPWSQWRPGMDSLKSGRYSMNSSEVGKVWAAVLFRQLWQSVMSGGERQSGTSENTHRHTQAHTTDTRTRTHACTYAHTHNRLTGVLDVAELNPPSMLILIPTALSRGVHPRQVGVYPVGSRLSHKGAAWGHITAHYITAQHSTAHHITSHHSRLLLIDTIAQSLDHN